MSLTDEKLTSNRRFEPVRHDCFLSVAEVDTHAFYIATDERLLQCRRCVYTQSIRYRW